jgi:hypothetical protein
MEREYCDIITFAISASDLASAVLVVEPLCFLHERVRHVPIHSYSLGSKDATPSTFAGTVILREILNPVVFHIISQIRVNENVDRNDWLRAEVHSGRFDHIHEDHNNHDDIQYHAFQAVDASDINHYCIALVTFRLVKASFCPPHIY